jgi:hypothetical protein
VAVIAPFLRRHPNARLVRNAKNQGVNANMNQNLAVAQGDVVFFAAADDVIYPTLFAEGMALLDAYPRAALFSARSDLIDEAGNNLGTLPIPSPLAEPGFVDSAAAARRLTRDDGWFMGNITLFRRASLLEAGGFPLELGAYADGFASRLLALTHGACFSPHVLGAWRRMETGYAWSQTANDEKARALIARVERHMVEAGDVFPAGYPARWTKRQLFGIRRLALAERRRRARARGLVRYAEATVAEAALTASLFLALRPRDIVPVACRRLAYLANSHFYRVARRTARSHKDASRSGA